MFSGSIEVENCLKQIYQDLHDGLIFRIVCILSFWFLSLFLTLILT